jgi:hypothetical protein
MQIKHTFLFTLILGLAWTGYLFAYAFGPDPAMNGINGNAQTCAVAGCHTSFPLNTSGGSVSVSGLPAGGWVAGQTYPLTVTITRTGQRAFGFQLSAVSDGTNQQAGSFARGTNVQVICGNLASSTLSCTNASAIQFAEHTSPASGSGTGTFTVNWTAPASASVGLIRFNVAGNAANGDGTNQGDYIFTNVYRVAAAAAPPPPDLTTHAFTMTDRGGVSIITDGSGAQLAGYSRIVPDSGQTTPTGVAIFGFRSNNILVSETGVPASPLVTAGRIYAEVNGPLDTGIAIANPNDSPATISFTFTDTAGIVAGSSTTTIAAKQQIARFLDEPVFKAFVTATFQGTFSFTSTVPVGVVALRGLTNERGEFLMSTLPVIDPTAAPATGTVILPHYADGGGWTTQIFLVNPTDGALSGTVQFPTNVTIAGRTSNSFQYSVAAKSSQKLVTSGAGATTASGAVRVVPTSGGTVPTALVLFSYKPGPVTVTEAGVPVATGSAFRLYVESFGTNGQAGNIQTGIAVANASTSSPASVTFEITDLNGAAVAGVPPATLNLAAGAQTAKFLSDLFPSLANTSFKGVLRISTSSATGISVVGLRARYNERQPNPDFLITTIPASNEANPADSAELLFPHLVNGGGYTTQFILFSGVAGQATSGNLRFIQQDGAGFSLTVN